MRILNNILSLLCVLLLSSCSAGGAYPYTAIEGDSYKTRLYKLSGGVKLYLTKNDVQPRATAALLLPTADSDTLDALYTPSVHSREYSSLYAQIGSHGAYIVENMCGVAICSDIPGNEIENWATIMRSSFEVLPDSFSIVISGDIVFDEVCRIIEGKYSDAQLYPTPIANECTHGSAHLLYALHPCEELMRRRGEDGTLSASDMESMKENYRFALADGFYDNSFRVRMMADALLRGDACNSATLFADKLDEADNDVLLSAAAQPFRVEALKPAVSGDAENTVSLASPLPARITFPDVSGLREKHLFDENVPDGYFRMLLHVDCREIPQTISKLAARYLRESLSASEVHIEVGQLGNSILLEFHGASAEAERITDNLFPLLKEVADGERFYSYLLKNASLLSAEKSSIENVATQASEYLAGCERYTGVRTLATLSMQRIFSQKSSLSLFGNQVAKLLPKLKEHFCVEPGHNKTNTSFPGDSVPALQFVALQCNTVYTLTYSPIEGAKESAIMQLFNIAARLSHADTLCRYTHSGVCLTMGVEDDSQLPFSEEAFNAARSLLLYDLSTYGNIPQSVAREYILQEQRGYSSSELYDAACGISYSDIKDFHRWHCKASKQRLVAGKGSSLELRSLAAEEGTVYITLDEMYGY